MVKHIFITLVIVFISILSLPLIVVIMLQKKKNLKEAINLIEDIYFEKKN